jgi:hypothetical protein
VTVAASPADLPPGTATNQPQPTGKGQSLLNAIATLQAAATAAPSNLSLAAALNAAQIAAVDYFMASYWVSADQILATFAPIPVNSKVGPFITASLAAISARAATVAALVAKGLPTITLGNQAPQYSVAYAPPNAGYPLTTPDVFWYQLNTQLVDFLMVNGILSAATILSTMTGTQTYPWNGYVSNYTFYQNDIAS